MKGYSLFVLTLLLSCTAAAQASIAAPHLTVSLASEHESLQPGKHAWVGIRFQLEKGWHVYWQNPGDSGEPPKVDWKLPDGFTAGPLRFPAPHRLPLQTLMNFGYEDDALYLSEISVPVAAKGNITIAANVRWMICKDTCIPGKGNLSLSLPVTPSVPKPSILAGLFKQNRERLPKKLGLRAAASFRGEGFVFAVRNPAKSAEFFPLDDLQIENAAPQRFAPKPGGFELTVRKSDQLAKAPLRIRGLIVIDGAQAFTVDLRVSLK